MVSISCFLLFRTVSDCGFWAWLGRRRRKWSSNMSVGASLNFVFSVVYLISGIVVLSFFTGLPEKSGKWRGEKIMFWVFRTWGFSVCVVLKVGEGKRRQSFLLCCFGWWETGYFMFGCWDMEKKKKSKVSLKNCFFFCENFCLIAEKVEEKKRTV